MREIKPAAVCALVRRTLGTPGVIRDENHALALLLNATLLEDGLQLVRIEDRRLGEPMTKDSVSNHAGIPIYGDKRLSLEYRHTGGSLAVDVLASDAHEATITVADRQVKVDIRRFVSAGHLPWSADSEIPLMEVFHSMSLVKEFSRLFQQPDSAARAPTVFSTNASIIAKRQTGTSQEPPRVAANALGHQRLTAAAPGIPEQSRPRPSDWPPDLEDEHRALQETSLVSAPRSVVSIGEDDLRPPGIDCMSPFRHRGGGHRGMYPTAEDIIVPRSRYDSSGERVGLPPAGARYDPVYPGDVLGDARLTSRDPFQGHSNASARSHDELEKSLFR
ncbi:hypothetical protein PYCC9005_006040 [Savitreella phatthalungensis]